MKKYKEKKRSCLTEKRRPEKRYGHPAATITGTFRGTGKGFAFLTPDGGGDDIFIPATALGSALNGDIVKADIYVVGGRTEARVKK